MVKTKLFHQIPAPSELLLLNEGWKLLPLHLADGMACSDDDEGVLHPICQSSEHDGDGGGGGESAVVSRPKIEVSRFIGRNGRSLTPLSPWISLAVDSDASARLL